MVYKTYIKTELNFNNFKAEIGVIKMLMQMTMMVTMMLVT